jgi:hypothetical protein
VENVSKRYLGVAIETFPELLFWAADRKIATSFRDSNPNSKMCRVWSTWGISRTRCDNASKDFRLGQSDWS